MKNGSLLGSRKLVSSKMAHHRPTKNLKVLDTVESAKDVSHSAILLKLSPEVVGLRTELLDHQSKS